MGIQPKTRGRLSSGATGPCFLRCPHRVSSGATGVGFLVAQPDRVS
jgi:hypothetical protein